MSSLRLDLRQGQHLTMTPEMQQAIKLLQMSAQELSAFVAEELEQNPLLVEAEADSENISDNETAERDTENTPVLDNREASDSSELANAQEFPELNDAPLDTEYRNLWGSDDVPGAGSGAPKEFADVTAILEQTATEEETLRDYLLDQLYNDVHDPAMRFIGAHLIDAIEESGYLPQDVAYIAETADCTAEQLELAVQTVQSFDPPGIAARSLKECLALQLKERDRLDPAMEALLEHLDLVAQGDMATLARCCEVDSEDVREMCAELRTLDPKPGLQFVHERVETIQPDVYVRRDSKGEWEVELNNEALPRVLIDRQYYAKINGQTQDKNEKQFLSQQMQTANWLIRAMDQRARSILTVATEIVARQQRFFEDGVAYLKPMVMREIAESVDLHESTVSRVAANKYIMTERGLFDMRYFFTSAVGGGSGEDSHSSTAVKHHIQRLIDAEDPAKILSDDALVKLLQQEGIEVARRTVAKYREALGIGSSPQRRKQKRHLAS